MGQTAMAIILGVLLALVSAILVFINYIVGDNRKRLLIPAGLWALFIGVCFVFSSLPLLNLPRQFAPAALYLSMLTVFAAAITFFIVTMLLPVLFIMDLVTKHTVRTSYIAWGALWMYLLLILAALGFDSFRMHRFNDTGKRNAQVISALESYRAENRGYPKKLSYAVPAAEENILGTGIVGYPYMNYIPLRNSSGDKLYCGYRLILDCPVGVRNPRLSYMTRENASRNKMLESGEWLYILMGDSFEYWSSQDYPVEQKGVRFKKLGKWVYKRKSH